jgi:hypothetical protein
LAPSARNRTTPVGALQQFRTLLPGFVRTDRHDLDAVDGTQALLQHLEAGDIFVGLRRVPVRPLADEEEAFRRGEDRRRQRHERD